MKEKASRLAQVFRMVSRCSLPFLMAGMSALPAQGFLPDAERTNGADTLKALGPVESRAQTCEVLVGKDSQNALHGVIVGQDGYVLTQASDTNSLGPLSVHLADGTRMPTREVHREPALNLLLLKVERSELSVPSWGDSSPIKTGQWLCALSGEKRQLRMGVLSAKRRGISDSGAVMGVRFGPGEKEDTGVYIEEVAEDGPAERAGLLSEDVIVSVNGETVNNPNAVRSIVTAHHAGDTLKIRYLREGKADSCDVLLASKSHVFMNWSGEDFANFGTSVRTDDFPQVLQHDLPLTPADMGGALYNLEGKAVGINIARVDRVTNYALPVEIFLPKVQEWIKSDRDGVRAKK